MAAKHASISTSNVLLPIQLGVGVLQRCDAAVHACREYTSQSLQDPSCDKVLIKVAMRNAFITIRRDKMSFQIADRCLEGFPDKIPPDQNPSEIFFTFFLASFFL